MRKYMNPPTLVMLALGFSSGMPFLLVGNTLGYWLRDEGTTLSAIGFLSWVGIVYSLKFLWAPLLDRLDIPLLQGRRRGWALLAQIGVITGLAAMAIIGTAHGLVLLGAFALLVALSAATQESVADAWRIELAAGGRNLGPLTSAYTFGYRMALLATDALILIAAQHMGWSNAYLLYSALMIVGVAATLFAREPGRDEITASALALQQPLRSARGLFDAVAGPFVIFFKTNGKAALLILIAISLYRLPDFLMGPMVNPFYHDIGITKDVVGEVRASAGLCASLIGIAAGGIAASRLGQVRALLIGGVLQAVAVAAYALLAWYGANMVLYVSIMAADSFAISWAGIALVTYMSGLTSLGHTATQYALLASSYAWAGKILKGFSGAIVDSLSAHWGLMHAYAVFYLGCGAIGIPSILLFLLLKSWTGKPALA